MKLVTRFQLARLNESELRAMLKEAFNAMSAHHPASMEYINALASIQNIQNELAARLYEG